MTDDSSQEEKQIFLRENILEQGYDVNMFVDFLMGKKGEGGADVGNWSMNDLQTVVKEFISMQSNDSNIQQSQPKPQPQPIITSIPQPTPAPVKKDPLSNYQKSNVSNDPLQNPKTKTHNDPLQPKQNSSKKIIKYDPLSGGISQPKEPQKKQNTSMADFFSTNNTIQNNNLNMNPQIQPKFNQNIKPQTLGQTSQIQIQQQNQPHIQPHIQPQIQPNMQNQFTQNYFNQFPNYANNPLQSNNPQFQPQLMQGQFPQLITPNQQQNMIQNTLPNTLPNNLPNTLPNNLPNTLPNMQNMNNNQQNVKTQDIKAQIPPPQKIEPIPETQNKIQNPPKLPSDAGKQNYKDDIGINYGIVINPTDECRVVDKTPLGIADNPSIQVGFPEKVEGGFFSKSYVTYLVTTIPLNIKVRRRYSDFEWLRQILTNLYIGNVIPTTPRKNKLGSDKFGDAFLQKRMRTLEKFLNYLLMNPIIKYSQLFYDFISIENEADFNRKKKEYEKLKPPQNVNENQSLIGRVNIEVKKEKEIFFENIKDNISFNETLLTKLNENFKLLKTQIENITLKIDEIAQNWSELCKTSTKYFDGDDIIQTYEHMSKLFANWSDALKRHNNIIHIDIREYFKYVKNNFKSMKDLVSVVETHKNTFTKNERYLINKKEDLYRKGDVNKWELDPNDNVDHTKLLQNKNIALMKIIPKETNNVINMKKNYGYYLNRIIDEYERIKSINSFLHKKNLVNACEKINEIYGDFQKGTADIINFFNMKNKTINFGNVNNIVF